MMNTRTRAAVAALSAVLVAGSGAAPSGAAPTEQHAAKAAAVEETVSRKYSDHRYVWVDQFNLCLSIYATSTLRVTYERRPISQGVVKKLKEPRILDPRLQMWVKKSCDDNSARRQKHRMNKVTYRNYYYGYTCSFNPSFSAGAPWSVGVGVTPECGEETVAKYGASESRTRRTNAFDLETEGFAFRWNQSDSATAPGDVKLCTSVSGWLRLRDTAGAERQTLIKKVRFDDACVSK